ncbi:helix-turn-helix transcriptional regulator [Streptomyces koyangensis]|uniref:helix-turn-helix transcriptional regulator n=1 Tax=Streptomyces koyangensis TaxID=188770 RepID=UPI003668F142
MDDHDLIRHPLAYARIQAGWTQPGLADRVRRAAERRGLHSGTRKQRIWAWETGRARPDADSQSYLAEIFGVDPAVAAATPWPDWLPGREQPHPFTRHSTAPALREALRTSMDRRTFLAYSTAALTGLTHQWATTEPAALTRSLDGDRLDPDLLDVLEESGLRLAGMITHQRQHTLAALDGHLATVTDLIADATYTADQAARLHTLGARLAQTVGWTRFDAGQHAAAARLWHGALHSAHAARDRDLGAGIISDLAYKPPGATTPPPPPRSSSTPSPAPNTPPPGPCCTSASPAPRPRSATPATAAPRSARAKTRAVFLSYRASSLLAQGHADEASVAATDSLTLAQTIGAPRCVTLIQRLRPRFEEHSQAPGVAEFLHASA